MQHENGNGLSSISSVEIEELTAALKRRLRARGLDMHTSEDVVQETWLLALRKRPSDHARGWLFGATSRILHAMRRANRNRRDRELDAARDESFEPDEEDAALGARLMGWVAEQPSPYREVLELQFGRGLDTSEIAALLGRPEATVRSQLKRGLDRLRARAGARPPLRAGLVLFVERLAALARRGGQRAHWKAAAWSAGAALLLLLLVTVLAPSRVDGDSVADSGAHGTARAATTPLESTPVARVPAGDVEPARSAASASAVRTIAGVVLDPSGAPVAGAAVSVGDASGKSARDAAITDASGRFVLRSVDASSYVWASAARWFDSRRRYIATHAEDATCELRLAGLGDVVRVRVVSPRGELVAGARVEVSDPAVESRMPQLVSGAIEIPSTSISRTTDANGEAELALPACDEVNVRVEAVGRVPWSALLATATIGATLEVRIPAPILLAGVVLDAAGGPASNATVELVQLEGAHMRTTRSDLDGSFRFEDAAPASYLVIAAEDPAVGIDSCRAEGEIVEGAPRELALALSPSPTLSGRVLGAPVGATARLRVSGKPEVPWQERARSLDDGLRFAFPGCDPGRVHRIDVFDAEGRVLATRSHLRTGSGDIELDASGTKGEELELEVEFERTSGTPLPSLVEMRSSDPPRSIVARVDPSTGRASFPRVPLAATPRPDLRAAFLIVAWIPQIGPCRVALLERAVSGKHVERVRLPELGRLRVELAPDGVASASAARGWIRGPGFNVHGFDSHSMQRLLREIVPDEHGSIELALPPGAYDVTLRRDGRTEVVERIEIEAGRSHVHTVVNERAREVEIEVDIGRALAPMERFTLLARTPRGDVRLAGRAHRWDEDQLELRAVIPCDTHEIAFSTSSGLEGSVAVPAEDEAREPRYRIRAVEPD